VGRSKKAAKQQQSVVATWRFSPADQAPQCAGPPSKDCGLHVGSNATRERCKREACTSIPQRLGCERRPLDDLRSSAATAAPTIPAPTIATSTTSLSAAELYAARRRSGAADLESIFAIARSLHVMLQTQKHPKLLDIVSLQLARSYQQRTKISLAAQVVSLAPTTSLPCNHGGTCSKACSGSRGFSCRRA